MGTAVIVLFHGSRAEGAPEAAARIVAAVRQGSIAGTVTAAFLQHGEPDLAAAVERCAAEGASQIVIVPFFLQIGMHVTADIPAAVRRLGEEHPGLAIAVTDAVGSHPLMAEIVSDLVRKAAEENGSSRKDAHHS